MGELISARCCLLVTLLVIGGTHSVQELEVYVDMGFFVGVTGFICKNKHGEALRAAVRKASFMPHMWAPVFPFRTCLGPRISSSHLFYFANLPLQYFCGHDHVYHMYTFARGAQQGLNSYFSRRVDSR